MGSPTALIKYTLFINNQATVASSSDDMAYACGGGYGGAMCIVGIPGSTYTVQETVFLNNSALFGGGLSVHADASCTTRQLSHGCFVANLDASCKFLNNTAMEGAGGALFWTRQGNLNISCISGRVSSISNGLTTAEAAAQLVVTPCREWSGNQVTGFGYGPVAASTSFYLKPMTLELPYYTSNELLPLQVIAQVRVVN